jgi:hypothetical protein
MWILIYAFSSSVCSAATEFGGAGAVWRPSSTGVVSAYRGMRLQAMSRLHGCWVCLIVLAVAIGVATPSQAVTGTVRVTVAKAAFIVGAGGGRGVLTFRHRNYPFTVQGLSLGLTAGASINELVGRAAYINELSDFAGTYSVVGAGVALVGGVGAVQLRNAKGVTLTLQGPKAGLELSANITKVVITLDPSRSTPD